MKRKVIYYAILFTICVTIVTTVPTMASWFFTSNNSATVNVKGSDAKLYSDAACTIPASGNLSFGDVRTSTPSNTVTVYLKNLGTDQIRPTVTITNIAAGLTVSESTYGVIATNTKLYTPSSYSFTPTTTNSLGVAVDNAQTTVQLTNGNFPAIYPFYFKIDNELFKATSLNIGYIVNVERTNPATHNAGTLVQFGNVSTIPELTLAPNAIQAISLTVTAQQGVAIGATVNFTLTINATSDY
jgi:hypothetical protein